MNISVTDFFVDLQRLFGPVFDGTGLRATIGNSPEIESLCQRIETLVYETFDDYQGPDRLPKLRECCWEILRLAEELDTALIRIHGEEDGKGLFQDLIFPGLLSE